MNNVYSLHHAIVIVTVPSIRHKFVQIIPEIWQSRHQFDGQLEM